MRATRLAVRLFIALSAAWLSVAGAQANYTYTYTDNNFTNVAAPYTTNDKITGKLVFLQGLAPNLDNVTDEIPAAFSFSDGQQTLDSQNAFINGSITLSTNAQGNIIQWYIEIWGDAPGNMSALLITENLGVNSISDMSTPDIDAEPFGSNLDMAGTWKVTVPESSTGYLLGAGILGLAFLGQRRRWTPAR
jgi:hypothetical protein